MKSAPSCARGQLGIPGAFLERGRIHIGLLITRHIPIEIAVQLLLEQSEHAFLVLREGRRPAGRAPPCHDR
jgi:hypothetical protein